MQAGTDVVVQLLPEQGRGGQLVAELASSGRRVECFQLALEDSARRGGGIAEVRGALRQDPQRRLCGRTRHADRLRRSITDEEWTRTFALDTHACFNLVHATLPVLKEQKGGSLTAVTTTQFSRHVPMSVLSSAPKAAIESMLQVVAREYGRYGVRANSVRSGWLDGGKFADGIGGQVSDKAKQAIVATIPLGALGDPSDVANAVVFLASRQARYVTGEASRSTAAGSCEPRPPCRAVSRSRPATRRSPTWRDVCGRRPLARSRDGRDWSQGVPLAYLQELVGYWGEGYDWRSREARINRFPQFRVRVGDLRIHCITSARSTRTRCRCC